MNSNSLKKVVGGVVLAGSVLTIVNVASSDNPGRTDRVFFEKPIPCHVYLEQKPESSSSYSLFQAKVQVLRIEKEQTTVLEELLKKDYPNEQERAAARNRLMEGFSEGYEEKPYEKKTVFLKIVDVLMGQNPGDKMSFVLPHNRYAPPPGEKPWYILGAKFSQDGKTSPQTTDAKFIDSMGWFSHFWEQVRSWFFECK